MAPRRWLFVASGRGSCGRCRMTLRVFFLVALAGSAVAQGHGGPIRALAVAPAGDVVVSGSFDASAIVWRLSDGVAARVLRFHAGGVNAVAALPDGGIATGGADGRIAV
jgi:cytochrome c